MLTINTWKSVYVFTELHHCLMGECVNADDARQAVMIEFEVAVIRRKKLKMHLHDNSNKEGIPYVTNFVLVLYVCL